MKVTYKNYIGESDGDRFNLFIEKELVAQKDTKNYKKGEKYTSLIEGGWSLTFEGMLRKIATLEMSNSDETLSISEYISEYRELLKSLNPGFDER